MDNLDVFCEKGVYELADSQRILAAGKACGLALNFHGEELNYLGCGVCRGAVRCMLCDMSCLFEVLP